MPHPARFGRVSDAGLPPRPVIGCLGVRFFHERWPLEALRLPGEESEHERPSPGPSPEADQLKGVCTS